MLRYMNTNVDEDHESLPDSTFVPSPMPNRNRLESIGKSTILSLADTKVKGYQSPRSPTIPAQALIHDQPYYA